MSGLPNNLPQRLSRRINSSVEYTAFDELLESIMSNFVTCPVSLEITNHMVIFNEQCYDQFAYRRIERMASNEHNEELREMNFNQVMEIGWNDPQ